jgi:hypothetical protein
MRTSARGLLLAVILALAAPAAAEELKLVRAVVHVHTDLTTGDLSLDEIVHRAESQGIEAIFLAENYLLRVDYGLPPFRALTRVRREEPSVLARGVERYLAAVAEARQRYPTVIIVPGVEVMPHYWWSGSPFDGELTVHDLQKNILAFGLSTEAALRALPATGSPATARFSAQSVVELLPVLLVIPGVVLLRPRAPRRRVVRRAASADESRRRWLGGLLCAIGVTALVRGFPFLTDAFTPYQDLGTAPYQELIDAVEQQGGAAVWSFPDAFDAGEQHVYGLRVTRKTDPYGDDLLRTFRYSAFGGAYEDTTRFPQLGGGWDYLLGQYARGERSRAAWLIGESGFHGDGDGKWIGAAETVFFVPAKSDAALLDALRRGRMYGVLRTDRTNAPVLERFTVTTPARAAVSGDTVSVAPSTPVAVEAVVRMSDASAQPIRVTLIKNGSIARMWTGTTPLTVDYREIFDGTPAYYRLDVRGPKTAYLLSNPIMLRGSDDAGR